MRKPILFPVLAFIFTFSGLAAAESSAGTPTKALYACAALTDPAARLACYDKEVANLKASEDTGEVRTVAMADVRKIERDAFGLSLPSLPQIFRRDNAQIDAPIEKITSNIKSINVHKVTKKITVTLENGQVWQQIDDTQLSRKKQKDAKSAEIRKASLGSFLLVLDGSGSAVRVRRVN
jgi:hypothetical protein